ncbi:acyltransferase [Streptomyces uncialis]|uniref:acyltransferase family protein n=1 Tax=Streptomyces uncialis TaxID=1048205 RepID=UPI002E30C085|nr:acyltransferase [Streptomyces uncialis]
MTYTPRGPGPGPATGTPDWVAEGRGTHRAGPVPPEAPDTAPAARAPGRDRYLDLLRTLALGRVVVYHIYGWAWLTIVFPSMGVMFALAGALMARSLKRSAWGVIKGRLRRLLPPLWVFGAVIVPLMFLAGWNPGDDPNQVGDWGWIKLLNWFVPFGTPVFPMSLGHENGLLDVTWAMQAAGPLWYLRAYLWFVIASPLLLWAFRRAPWVTLLAPLALTAVVGTGLVDIPGSTGYAVRDFAVFAGCWVLGFAHQDGVLARLPRYITVSVAALIMSFGLWWASGHPTDNGMDLNEIPLAQATWSFGAVAILLVYAPSWQRLPGRLARFDKVITLFNNRAVTIYLWHNTLIMGTILIIDKFYDLPFMDEGSMRVLTATFQLWMLILVWPLIALMILAVGWVEDLAAGRRLRLWPTGPERQRSRPRRAKR